MRFRKLFDEIIYKSLYQFCVFPLLAYRGELRILENDSTINQLISITHEIQKSFDEGKDACRVVFGCINSIARGPHSQT